MCSQGAVGEPLSSCVPRSRDCGQVYVGSVGQAGEEGRIESIREGFLKLFMEETAQIYGFFCESSSNVGAGGFAGLEGWIEGAQDMTPWKKEVVGGGSLCKEGKKEQSCGQRPETKKDIASSS